MALLFIKYIALVVVLREWTIGSGAAVYNKLEGQLLDLEGHGQEGSREQYLQTFSNSRTPYFFDYPIMREEYQFPVQKREKGIQLDVGDYAMNGGPHGGLHKGAGEIQPKTFLLKSPVILGMMRHSG